MGEQVSSATSNAVGTMVKTIADKGFKNIFSNGILKGLKTPNISLGIGAAASMVESFLPEKTEYSGDKGLITKGLDTAYDAVATGVNAIPVAGLFISTGMAVNKLAGHAMNAIGGGTDGMTTQDAILGSSFLATDPLSLVNGFFGKRADTMTKDNEAFAMTGNSYSGTSNAVDYASHFSNKKFGLFSSGARKRANALMAEMGRKQATVRDIGENTQLTNELLANLASMATNAAAYEQSGGYDMTATRAAKEGMKITLANVTRVKNILKPKILLELIPAHKEGSKINIREQALPKHISRAIRVAKLGIKIEKPILYNYDCLEVTDEMIASLLGTPEFKEGGVLSELPNLIPEGALHAHLHHMENDEDITKKGIPVVVEEEGGHLNLLAEIEKNEIILNKELTDLIEKLYKKYYSEDISSKEKNDLAIEAGKLLSTEIVENTDDRTGLMETI